MIIFSGASVYYRKKPRELNFNSPRTPDFSVALSATLLHYAHA